MDRASKETVDLLLEKVKECIRSDRSDAFMFVPRRINRESMAKLGISENHIVGEILELTYDDYHAGPLDDRNRPGTEPLWVFKRIINGALIYIKLKYRDHTKGKTVLVLSFHEDGAK